MTKPDRLAIAMLICASSLTLASFAAPLKFHNMPAWLIDLSFYGGLLGIASSVGWIAIEHLDAFPLALITHWPHRMMSLREAAAALYGEMRGTEWGRFTESVARNEDEILDAAGQYIITNIEDVRVRRSPSTRDEQFDRNNLATMGVRGGATEIRQYGEGREVFIHPTVRRRDLRECIRALKATYRR